MAASKNYRRPRRRRVMTTMNKTVTGVTLAGVLAVIAALSANGKGLAEGLTAMWLFLVSLAETAPLGLSSFALAIALAVGVQAALVRWLPLFRCSTSRDLVMDLAAFLVGFGVMWAQTRAQVDPADRLNGLLLGALAGFLAPYVFKGIAAVVSMAARRWKVE